MTKYILGSHARPRLERVGAFEEEVVDGLDQGKGIFLEKKGEIITNNEGRSYWLSFSRCSMDFYVAVVNIQNKVVVSLLTTEMFENDFGRDIKISQKVMAIRKALPAHLATEWVRENGHKGLVRESFARSDKLIATPVVGGTIMPPRTLPYQLTVTERKSLLKTSGFKKWLSENYGLENDDIKEVRVFSKKDPIGTTICH